MQLLQYKESRKYCEMRRGWQNKLARNAYFPHILSNEGTVYNNKTFRRIANRTFL